MRYYFDTEHGQTISEEELRTEFAALVLENPDEYNYSFEKYLQNCTGKDGTLIEIYD